MWRRGSVVASWLLDLTAGALAGNPNLDGLAGRVSDSGEGRWTVKAAIDEGVPAPVLSASLFARFSQPRRGRLRRQAALGHAPGSSAATCELPTGDSLEAGTGDSTS